MLLDDRQVAINDLIIAFREASDHYEKACERLADEHSLQPLFRTVRASHARSLDALEVIIHELGELPRAPSIDREDLQDLVTRVKTALSDDETRTLLEERLAAEHHLADQINSTLTLEFFDTARDKLQRIRQEQRDQLNELQKALEQNAS